MEGGQCLPIFTGVTCWHFLRGVGVGGRRAVSAHFHSSNMLTFFCRGWGWVEGGQCLPTFTVVTCWHFFWGGGGWKEGSVSFPFPYTVL